MAVEIVWDDEQETIVRHIYHGHVIVDDYIKAVDETYKKVASKEYIVHVIIDRLQIQTHPALMTSILRYANTHVLPNLGLRIVVTPTFYNRVMMDIARVVAPRLTQNVHYVSSVEEAHRLIASYYVQTYS